MLKLTGNASDFLNIAVKAAARNNILLVKEILAVKPHWISHIGSHGRTMLWEACHKGKIDMVKFLVDQGADINASGTHYTPYFVELSCYCISKYKKHESVATYLLEQGAIQTIHSAAFLGDLDEVRSLLDENPTLINQGHPQHVMAGKNDQGLDFVAKQVDWATPLCYALRGGHIAVTSYLLDTGARIAGFEKHLFIAADDHLDMLRLLLSNGADPSFAPRVSPTDKEAYKLLSEYGVEPISVKELSEELVYLCRGDRGGNPSEVKQLLESGADINHQDAKGKTALHRAVRSGFIRTIILLLEHGADVEITDNNGETALFETVRSTIKKQDKLREAYSVLIDHGAKLSMKNKNEETVLDVAKELGVNWLLITKK